MHIVNLPFNSHVGIARAEGDEFELSLSFSEHLTNHLGTVHASALFALAEATSGEFLIHSRGARNDIGGVVRRSSSKYSRPATGDVFSLVKTAPSIFEEAIAKVDSRGKALVDVEVELVDANANSLATFSFTWMLAADEVAE